MYNIDLKENEIIIYNNDEAKIKTKNKILDISLVITNYRLIILQDGNKLGDMNNLLKLKGLGFIPNREIIFQININDIKEIIYNEYTKILFNNHTFIEVKDENIKHILGSD